MTEALSLTIAFLEQKPQAAGQTLSSLPPEDAAALMETLPLELAGNLLGHMDAWPACIILSHTQSATAVDILPHLNYQHATAILRLMTPAQRRPLLQEMPEQLKRSFERSLSFPQDTVGAQMNTAILTMRGADTVGDAIERFRTSRQPEVSTVFIVDQNRNLQGLVSSAVLIRNASDSPLADIMDTGTLALSSRARLTTVAAIANWEDYAYLPVLNRDGHLIGALARKTAHASATPTDFEGTSNSSIGGSMTGAFIASAMGLADLLTDSRFKGDAPTARRQKP